MQKVVDGILVNFEQIGQEKKDAVILPGWKASIAEWLPIAESMTDKYRVTVIDFPGFGASESPPKNWGIFEYAQITKHLLEKLGIRKTTIIGHSFGGRIGILLAANTDVVEKLVLVDGAGMEIKDSWTRVIKFLSLTAAFMPEFIKQKVRSSDYEQAGELREIMKRIVNQPLRGELMKIKVPTLIIWGEKDRVLSIKEADMLVTGIKESVLRIVWGSGHWPHVEKRDELIRIFKEENV